MTRSVAWLQKARAGALRLRGGRQCCHRRRRRRRTASQLQTPCTLWSCRWSSSAPPAQRCAHRCGAMTRARLQPLRAPCMRAPYSSSLRAAPRPERRRPIIAPRHRHPITTPRHRRPIIAPRHHRCRFHHRCSCHRRRRCHSHLRRCLRAAPTTGWHRAGCCNPVARAAAVSTAAAMFARLSPAPPAGKHGSSQTRGCSSVARAAAAAAA